MAFWRSIMVKKRFIKKLPISILFVKIQIRIKKQNIKLQLIDNMRFCVFIEKET